MAYLGRALTSGNYLKLDDISSQFNGSTTTFNLTSGGQAFYPGSPYSLIVSVAGVVQEPESAFQINENQIIFATAPGGSDDFFCIVLGLAVGIGVPGDSTVTGNKLAKPLNYNNGHLYFDSVNDRLGINTTVPSSALDVVGDAKVSGALTATSLSISGNVSIAGTLTYEDVTNVDYIGIITARNGIVVNSGGINATGVVTASDGFNLGISSAGTTITSGPVTTLNFVGTGNTFAINGTTVDISISGGGNAGAGGTWSSNAVGVHTTKIVGVGTDAIAGAANSEGVLQAHGNVAIIDGALLTDIDVNTNVFIPSGKNGLLIGPVTVGAGFTVDVASGSVLVVV